MISTVRWVFAAAVAFLAAPLAVPLAAQDAAPAPEAAPAPLPDLAPLTGPQLYELFAKDDRRWVREPCSFGVPLLTEIEGKAVKPLPIRRLRVLAEALCADREERYADGLRLSRQIAEITPDDPEIGLTLYFARRLKDADGLLAILRGIEGPRLEVIDEDEYYAIGRVLDAEGRGADFDSVALGWVDDGKLGFIDTQLHSGIAVRALRAAALAGRSDLTDQLLVSITNPGAYIDLLTFREFESFWPQIEARAGPNLSLVGDEHVRVTRARLTNAVDDRDRFSDAAHALHFNGQFEEAIALAQRWRERAERGVAIEEGDAWALNIEAYSYDSLGQPGKADAVFDELATYDPEEHFWVVNFVINRASRLIGQGRWKQGLAATDLARAVADKHGTTYAKLIIASDRACAFERLKRAGEAEGELAYLRENWKDGIALTVRGLLCHGLKDEAAALLLTALRDKAERGQALSAFQTDELDLFYTATILPQASDLPAAYPELAAELALHMRAMPKAFIPQAALKRVALKEGTAR